MAEKPWQDGWVVVPEVRAMRETVYGVKTHYVHAGEGEPPDSLSRRRARRVRGERLAPHDSRALSPLPRLRHRLDREWWDR
jgi:hypothetical protein